MPMESLLCTYSPYNLVRVQGFSNHSRFFGNITNCVIIYVSIRCMQVEVLKKVVYITASALIVHKAQEGISIYLRGILLIKGKGRIFAQLFGEPWGVGATYYPLIELQLLQYDEEVLRHRAGLRYFLSLP